MIKIYKSSELKGLTGDNGETVCVFIRDNNNPLNSGWAWFDNMENANIFIDSIK